MIPRLEAPVILIVAEATTVLLESSESLLTEGILEADLPEQIRTAQRLTEDRLNSLFPELDARLRQTVRTLLRLTPPESVSAMMQDLIDQGQGPNLSDFLIAVDQDIGSVSYPKQVVYPTALRYLRQAWHLSPDEATTLDQSIAALDDQLRRVAEYQRVDPSELQAQTREWLTHLPIETVQELVQHYLDEEDAAQPESSEAGSVTVVGPILFMAVTDYLLEEADIELTSDQRLDLQTNRVTAEKRYRAMDKLGRIDDEAMQRATIRRWIVQQSPQALLDQVDQLFESV